MSAVWVGIESATMAMRMMYCGTLFEPVFHGLRVAGGSSGW